MREDQTRRQQQKKQANRIKYSINNNETKNDQTIISRRPTNKYKARLGGFNKLEYIIYSVRRLGLGPGNKLEREREKEVIT